MDSIALTKIELTVLKQASPRTHHACGSGAEAAEHPRSAHTYLAPCPLISLLAAPGRMYTGPLFSLCERLKSLFSLHAAQSMKLASIRRHLWSVASSAPALRS